MKQNGNRQTVVCIGGGTGTFVVLRGLKQYPITLKSIVTMSDSGGSNKRLRDEFGLLPTSDIRQSFVALSEDKGGAGLLRTLFMYRFDKGRGISGMTFGNLFMAALTDILGSQEEAIRQTGKVLRIHGTVIPVSFTHTDLHAEYENGQTVPGEHEIDEPAHDGKIRITKTYLSPRATANPEALQAIATADMIVLGPGDLYTSLIPNLLVDSIPEAIRSASAVKVYVMNLMTKYGQTYGFSASDHIRSLEKFIGTSLDYVVMNSAPLNARALKVYAKSQEIPVADDLPEQSYYRVIRYDVAGSDMVVKSRSDMLVRSLIRHDSDKLAHVLSEILSHRV